MMKRKQGIGWKKNSGSFQAKGSFASPATNRFLRIYPKSGPNIFVETVPFIWDSETRHGRNPSRRMAV